MSVLHIIYQRYRIFKKLCLKIINFLSGNSNYRTNKSYEKSLLTWLNCSLTDLELNLLQSFSIVFNNRPSLTLHLLL
ncbi:unnamed protein product [Moneuplotes crassus]|uniref:Uncharacterized protein n=1 Tax=Euplotes crassus TaxID=5936 RepID=A0AAD1UEH1_EUPCR|nr:unnamed protein product [Moneuplotes crassus]